MTVEARHVGRWRFTTLRREVDNSRDIADLDLNLDLMADKDRTVVQLVLTGTLTVTDRAALDACLDKYSRLFAWLGLWERHSDIAVVPADGEFDDLGIGGFAASAVDELVDTARSGDAMPPRTPRARWRCCCGWPRREWGGMKLHRLVLTNYRGITHREIEFPDHGVTVVCGPNEIGKSSMIEALDLLLESKDRSTKKDVKQVKPTHADVGSEVTAEISTGPYRFVYRKRFHKKCETELTVLAPQREQLTGDEAHDRVRADAGRDGRHRAVAGPAGAAGDLDVGGRLVRLRRAVARARRRRRRCRRLVGVVGDRAAADRADRRRVQPRYFTADRPADGGVGRRDRRAGRPPTPMWPSVPRRSPKCDDRVRRHARARPRSSPS